MDNLRAADSPLPRSPSPGRAASPVVDEAPALSIVHCSQPEYRMEEYERQNAPLPGHEKVGCWLCDVQAAYESDGPSSYPTPPAAPRKDQYNSDLDSVYGRPRQRRRRSPPVMHIKKAEFYVHKNYEGRLPLSYYAA